MRFFSSVLTVSLVAVAAGLAINRGVDVDVETPIDIKEACRGLTIWHPDGFYRSGTTVRYHGHMWQCTRWNQGKENPEESDVWRDLGACDPDVKDGQMVLSKRSAPLEARDDDDDDDDNCRGFLEWDASALSRSGTTVHYKGALWQNNKWNKGEEPGVSSDWTSIRTCKSKKVKRSCNGFPTFVKGALNRPGNTVQHDNKLYQANHWTQTSTPDDTEAWSLLGDC
ncbi:unnamed protein product [Rhizoctonia solani]|uniref:Chitin-binding type-3 domain-containing protein n=1 Tax=Rhizoctonia solani TaxID=456999 RepID=A0A8H3GU11_9AGAM|nr:hypothetical protein RHS01_04349 [Rhizoctonia solani]CAE6465380.1 unnamed protein product [Rhizoctonia solani]